MSKFSIRAMIEAMQPGDRLEFRPHEATIAGLTYYASRLGKKLGREYHFRNINSRGVYQISREA